MSKDKIDQALTAAIQHNSHAIYMCEQDKLYSAQLSIEAAVNYVYDATNMLDSMKNSTDKDTLIKQLDSITAQVLKTIKTIKQYG